MLSSDIQQRLPSLTEAFRTGRPFRHVVIDEFLDGAFASRLLAEFPAFAKEHALNEIGEVGGKAVVEKIRGLGTSYAELDDTICSTSFLDVISRITGIPDLLYDKHYFGGGTHENCRGQDLDPHVDFNYHPLTRWHRRLNLIIYLNPEWNDAWGGNLELHSDPGSEHDVIQRVIPSFNRAVIFETNEISWHGFSRIATPADRPDLTRRSIAIYFYTKSRPIEETAAAHSTIYVDRPLPDHIRAGHTLTEEDVQTIRTLLARRDQHTKRLYGMLKDRSPLDESGTAQLQASGHLGRMLQGLARVASDPGSRSTAGFKAAFIPFVSALPAPLQWPTRQLWRLFTNSERCALCGASGGMVRPVGPVKPTHPGPFQVNEYRLMHCAECDCVRLDPTPNPTDLRTLYEGSEQFSDATYTDPERVAQMLEYYGGCIERHALLPKGPARVLEVGAGLAWVSRACKQRHDNVYTLAQDVSSECRDLPDGVDHYHVGTIEALPLTPGFDLISLTHVIEHVPDPERTLRELARRLNPSGRIFITAPHRPPQWRAVDGLQPWLDYSYLHVPAHISYLSQSWFARTARRCGLELLHWNAEQDHHQAFEAVLG